MSSKSVLVLCGPSGCGKSTLIQRLKSEFGERFGLSVSHTTRQPRSGEEEGVHYHFVGRATMEAMRAKGEFLETAEVHGNLYGTSFGAVAAVQDARKICILDIDVQGAELVRASERLKEAALYVFVRPPSLEILETRLRGRATETEEKIQVRLANAKKELEVSERPDFWDAVLVNDDLEMCYSTLKELVSVQCRSM